ncbi:hypothetical protein P3T76_015250 [Phytophthora citrophthora]|uniref:Uncharacterized protein n=1 Tax=Phytophthora citrophthora TaxID=4793 RepID=A0AAD9FZT7_9STRA|nr:hypothetical protein P3T76_015250 [Phytophthora citrophthora]
MVQISGDVNILDVLIKSLVGSARVALAVFPHSERVRNDQQPVRNVQRGHQEGRHTETKAEGRHSFATTHHALRKRKRSGRPFATALRPDAGVVRRVRAMFRAGLLVQQSTSRNSIAFLLSGNSSESERNIVRVVSKHSPRLFDELHRHTVEDLPVSSQFNKLTARMETLGMPEGGWSIDVQDRSCPFKVWTKFGSCIHALFAMEIRGASDIQGRETLVNCSHSRTVMRAGRPKNIGRSLSME